MISVQDKITQIKSQFHESDDLADRLLEKEGEQIGFIYLKSITNAELFAESVFEPIALYPSSIDLKLLQDKIIRTNDVKEIEEDEIVDNLIKGAIIIILSGQSKFMAVDLQKYPTRVPDEPPTSPVIMGPREGFIEDLKSNISLMRRRLASKDLVIKQMKIGKFSSTKVVVTYLHGIADDKIVKKVQERLKQVDIDGVIDSHYLIEFLQERPNSIFRQVGMAEKPDIIASKLLEGKVAIIVDNSPIVLTVPFILFEDLQNSNDYYTNHHYSGFIRAIRVIGILLAIISSGLYLALQIYHYNVLPLNFLVTIADTTQGLPFTPFLEILFIYLLFQILYEVSLRLPSYLGLATSVVGGLILGDTGVKAGLLSPPGVIIVAVSKIALYLIPQQNPQITLLQVIFIILGGSLGILGIIAGIVYFTNYLNAIDSYGSPYLAPYGPRIVNDLQDGIFKLNLPSMKYRPEVFHPKDKVRIK